MPEIKITIIEINKVNEIQHQLIYKANGYFKDFKYDNSDVVVYLSKELEISHQKALKSFKEMIKEVRGRHDLFIAFLRFLHTI